MEEIKKRIKEVFAKAPKFELVEMPFIDVAEDPVRPELSLEFRQAYGRKIYGIKDTVWAKKKGGGKHIVNEVYKMIKESNHLSRLITLSPLTDMARKFHLKNGAKEVQVNLTTQNFEYDIELTEWEKLAEKVTKKWRNATWSIK